MTWAKPGVKCVCVCGCMEFTELTPQWERDLTKSFSDPKKMEVCIIRNVVLLPEGTFLFINGYYHHYHISAFRPLTQSESDLELFRDITTPSRLDELNDWDASIERLDKILEKME